MARGGGMRAGEMATEAGGTHPSWLVQYSQRVKLLG